MTVDNTCPICGFQGITADKAKCPQCDADISCFRVLDSLPDTMTTGKAVSRYGSLVSAAITLLLCVILGGFLAWIYGGKRVEPPASYGPIYPVRVKIDMKAELERSARKCPAEPAKVEEREVPAPAPVSGAVLDTGPLPVPEAILFGRHETAADSKGTEREPSRD